MGIYVSLTTSLSMQSNERVPATRTFPTTRASCYMAGRVLLERMNMKFLVAFIFVLLASVSWADCPVPSQPGPPASRSLALEELTKVGLKHYQEGQYQKALACYTEALHTAEALRTGDTTIASILNNLAVLAEDMGNHTEARNYYLRQLDLLGRAGDAGTLAAGETYTKLAGLSQIQGAFADAETSYKKAIALLTRHGGAGDLRAAEALSRLGRLYVEWGKFAEAPSPLRKARAIAERSLPEDDPQRISFLDAEAYLLFHTGKFAAAEKNWMAALKIAEHTYGENVIDYSSLLFRLGQMYSLMGDYPSAEAMLQRCLAAEEKTTGSDPVHRAIIMSSLAEAYTKQRKLREAEPLVLKSVEASNANCREVPIACSLIRSNLGEYYMTKGQWETAKPEFELALKLREEALGEHPLVADSLTSLSRVLRKLKRKKEAKIHEARAVQILSNKTSPVYGGGSTIDVRTFQAGGR